MIFLNISVPIIMMLVHWSC